jgi:hypothetical protein
MASRSYPANDVINRVAAEVGLIPVTDPFSSTDDTFLQLRNLLNSAGQELVQIEPWQHLIKEHQITTASSDSGKYDLPDDFAYMIDQTQWDRTNDVAVAGPLSPQDWTYLLGRDLVSDTIYASFRQVDNQFWLFPQPPPDGLDINFEYMSLNWVASAQNPGAFTDIVNAGADTVLYEPILIIKYLKTKFLEAKGFDSTVARAEFGAMFEARLSRDKGSPILNAGGNIRSYPYLDGYRSLPDTNYGR